MDSLIHDLEMPLALSVAVVLVVTSVTTLVVLIWRELRPLSNRVRVCLLIVLGVLVVAVPLL
jgi:Na+-transporting NADH:ubiquinone oxidoreductase subunit NqrD